MSRREKAKRARHRRAAERRAAAGPATWAESLAAYTDDHEAVELDQALDELAQLDGYDGYEAVAVELADELVRLP
jgi:hypothetical protein